MTLEVALLLIGDPVPGPGPLGWVLRIAILHAAIVAPSLGAMEVRWSLFVALLALPFLMLVSWGHAVPELRDGLLLFASAVACGASGSRLRNPWYPPSVILLFVLPFALGYLCEEFGRADVAGWWRALSPWSLQLGAGLFALWAWPLWALARRRA